MSSALPSTTQALVLVKSPQGRSPPYHDAVVQEQPIPALKPGEILVKMGTVAFNHRDEWIRRGMYPRIRIGSTFGADGAGTVVAAADPSDSLLRKRVFLTPMRGWVNNPDGPESEFGILGGGEFPRLGTFAEYVVVSRDEVIETPAHLTDEQAAAWPLAGLTAWRAVALARINSGSTVLITGIGGGVALLAMQLCIAMGAHVYVTSGSQAKIDRAVGLGARGGVRYSDDKWPRALEALLKSHKHTLDAVIDSGGAEILDKTSRMLKFGGRVVCLGMTAAPAITMKMRDVMRGLQLIGTMMGSRADLDAGTAFLAQHKIVPVVGTVLRGLGNAEEGFRMMARGEQFGKIVVRVEGEDNGRAKASL